MWWLSGQSGLMNLNLRNLNRKTMYTFLFVSFRFFSSKKKIIYIHWKLTKFKQFFLVCARMYVIKLNDDANEFSIHSYIYGVNEFLFNADFCFSLASVIYLNLHTHLQNRISLEQYLIKRLNEMENAIKMVKHFKVLKMIWHIFFLFIRVSVSQIGVQKKIWGRERIEKKNKWNWKWKWNERIKVEVAYHIHMWHITYYVLVCGI